MPKLNLIDEDNFPSTHSFGASSQGVTDGNRAACKAAVDADIDLLCPPGSGREPCRQREYKNCDIQSSG